MLSPNFINDIWYGKSLLALFLVPLSWLYIIIILLRQLIYKSGVLPVNQVGVPVIVVGNITAGGAGKTPLVIWIVNYLKQNGFNPGIVSRGYGGQASQWPQQVRTDSDPVMVGDEPVIIAKRTGCPVAASPDRSSAATGLVEYKKCNIIVSDDGLQHYALGRNIEIAVVDSVRRFGNRYCLPAGPLREPVSRLNSVDLIVSNGLPGKGEHQMEYVFNSLISVKDENIKCEFAALQSKKVHAIAGIAYPERFFNLLKKHGLDIIEHPFPDHYIFKPTDINFSDNLAVVMTEKDAVKCSKFVDENYWYLPIDVKMSNTFIHRLTILLKELNNGQETA